ncbi:MAG: PaaI family thioesterase [Candidatus Dormiibacterota bacterium]
MQQVTYDGRCFGCGEHNDDGLQMRFAKVGDESICDFTVPPRFQSWEGVIHGGIVALMLDEAIGWACWHRGHPGVTGRLEVRYRQPLRVGEQVRVAARIDHGRRSLHYASGWIERLADGSKIAEASATVMEIPTEVTVAPGSLSTAEGSPG